jgi:chromosome condensin MukBEF ATPase and DNA-binding subunit MukB
VNGVVQAKEVLVNTGWSDYVFAPNYPLRPLKEVAAFIQEHHHLPEIPTEAEVHQDGVSLGEMQAKLLAKIEELTLHMIQAEERNDQLEKQNQALQTRIARLEAQADAIVKPNTAK